MSKITPGTITAIANLIAELAAAGISIAGILEEAKASGKVSPERWAEIIAEIDAAEAGWRNA